jgi:hypothetical protein
MVDSIKGTTDVDGGSEGCVGAAKSVVGLLEQVVGGCGTGMARAEAMLVEGSRATAGRREWLMMRERRRWKAEMRAMGRQ